jgi:hypothetical protein
MGGADQAQVALIDEVAESDALVLIFLGYGYNEPEVGADKLVERFGLARPDALREVDFVFALEKRIRADFLEILIEGTFLSYDAPDGGDG